MPSDDLNVLAKRELELEWIRAHESAKAARLEARAAEIELLLLAQLRDSGNRAEPNLPGTAPPSPEAARPASMTRRAQWEGVDARDASPAPERPFPPADLTSQHRAAEELIAAIQRLVTAQTHGLPAWMPSTPVGHRPQGSEASAEGWADRLRTLQAASGQAFRPVVSPARTPHPFTPQPGLLATTQPQLPANPATVDADSGAIVGVGVGVDGGTDATGLSMNPADQIASNHGPAATGSLEPCPVAGVTTLAAASIESRAASPSPDLPDQPSPSLAAVKRTSPSEPEVGQPIIDGQQATRSAEPALTPAPKSRREGVARETLSEGRAPGAEAVLDLKPTAKHGGRGQAVVSRPIIPDWIRFADTTDEPPVRRLRPAAWMISLATHLGLLAALALLTLSMPQARDQLAFSASATETAEASVETFTLEPAEEVTESLETSHAEEPVAETSPLGEVAIGEVAVDVATATAPSAAAADVSPAADLASSQLAAASENRVQFAGVDGGGNHFVYLVDSSNSMRNFNEARQELLRSVDALQADQRFYVIFYDESPAMMRLTAANEDEPTSVLATAENKLALRRWAMTIGQEKGRSPIETLEFAFHLEPDAIFLLSDGEFSAATEEVIEKSNRYENLFGESQLVSIIHTIRYPGHSTAGVAKAEIQMRRIAETNGGQYRNVEIR